MFECAVFCARICLGDIESPSGFLAKIFYQTDSVCSAFYVFDFILQ